MLLCCHLARTLPLPRGKSIPIKPREGVRPCSGRSIAIDMGYYDKYSKFRGIRSRHPQIEGNFAYLVIICILEQSTPAHMGEDAAASVGHVRLCSLVWAFLGGGLKPALHPACPIGRAPPPPIGSQPPSCRPGASGERLGHCFCSHPLAAPSTVHRLE